MKFKLKTFLLVLFLSNLTIETIGQKNNYTEFGFHFSKNRKIVTVPFQLLSNLIVVPVIINKSDTLNFILDTGVSNIIITDPKLGDKLGLKKTRKVKISGAGEGKEQMAHVSPGNTFRMCEIQAKNQNIVILENDFFEISEILGKKIHGIFGYDIFNYFVVNIDFMASNIYLQKPEKYKYRPWKGELFPIEIEDTKPYLNDILIEIDNKSMLSRLMIDTGAGHAISLELDKNDELKLPKKLVRSQLGKGLSGIINGNLGRTDRLVLGKYELKDIVTSFPDSESISNKLSKEIVRNGNLGCDILRRFNVTFNYRDKYMILKPINSRIKETFEHNMSGIEFIAKGVELNEFFIDRITEDSPGYLAGFREGDQVIAINNINYTEETLSNIYKILQKKEGRIISMVIKRGNEFIQSSFVLKRLI